MQATIIVTALFALAALGCGGDPTSGESGTVVSPSDEDPAEGAAGDDSADSTGSTVQKGGHGGSRAPSTRADAGLPPGVEACKTAISTEVMPARTVAMSPDTKPAERIVFTPDLFEAFDNLCGTCHVVQGLGDFRITGPLTMPEEITKDLEDSIIDSMVTDDKAEVMPPYEQTKKLGSDRKPGDPVYELTELFREYFKAGKPVDLFYMPASLRQDGATAHYTLSEKVGMELTNIGNCTPTTYIMSQDASTMDKLDAFWAQAKELPKYLDQTDLTTYDSEALARSGVVAYAPAYPLYSDGAHKLRHIRVPHGKSVDFDKDKQEFLIPDNTRFYKTFFKKVIEADGSERWRKLETRLIVARQNGELQKNGAPTINALFGTYAWDANETTAELVTDPLRNGKPFRDRLVTYIVDEGKAAEALGMSQALDRRVALADTHATRTWAIPGSERCIQCHMGSHTRNFALGFEPLQIARRKTGEGGTYEDTSDDELAQLQRLIDLGVISRMTVTDILPLEASQGERKPRNDHELRAQGYILGNCANCHNPLGYPSIENPPIRDLLNFFPNSQKGGVFQFPLERVSPRIKRGIDQSYEIPYITPSLVDMAQQGSGHNPSLNPGAAWNPREIPASAAILKDKDSASSYYMGAPWRSLIYRNVETPYLYAEDYALYPHMPMNAAGFDARAPRIMGDWMVSIPSKLRLTPGATDAATVERNSNGQPYLEVLPTDPDYAAAKADAALRMKLYHNGGRAPIDYFSAEVKKGDPHYTFFDPVRYQSYEPDDSDTVVENTAEPDKYGLPVEAMKILDENPTASLEDDRLSYWALFPDGVPDRPNWIRSDFTDPPGDWYPRRSDWETALAIPSQKSITVLDPLYPSPGICQKLATDAPDCVTVCDDFITANCAARDDDATVKRKLALSELRFKTLTQSFRDFALEPRPFASWRSKSGCSFRGVRRISEYPADKQWSWMSGMGASADTPVYEQSIGAGVFKEICINCHGRELDSRGRQATKLAELTGGKSRVANFRDGLLGPREEPGKYKKAVFEKRAGGVKNSLTAEDWAARYVAWMGLGGTNAKIDPTILGLIANELVFGEKRPYPVATSVNDANMLGVAQVLCHETIGNLYGVPNQAAPFDLRDGKLASSFLSSIESNGDGEMWRRLCAFQNQRPVMVLGQLSEEGKAQRNSLRMPTGYPADAPLGDHLNTVRNGITEDNQRPWCVLPPANDADKALVAKLSDARRDKKLPICPDAWLASAPPMSIEQIARWASRGAINAGFAVYAYLDDVTQKAKTSQVTTPNFDECELLDAQP